MKPTSLTKITLEGYKSFRKLELELRPLNVLIGANGVGKSNLVSFFRFAAQLTNGRYPKTVVEAGGADVFLRYGKKITKPFRKMGHVTIMNKDSSRARKTALALKKIIKIIS